jgi:hypothetical protein
MEGREMKQGSSVGVANGSVEKLLWVESGSPTGVAHRPAVGAGLPFTLMSASDGFAAQSDGRDPAEHTPGGRGVDDLKISLYVQFL